jgi:hypothetical protein
VFPRVSSSFPYFLSFSRASLPLPAGNHSTVLTE